MEPVQVPAPLLGRDAMDPPDLDSKLMDTAMQVIGDLIDGD